MIGARDTPLWVWGVLIYLLYISVQAIQVRVVSLFELFAPSFVLMAFKYTVWFTQHAPIYAASVIAGMAIGVCAARRTTIKVLKELYAIELPGTCTTLIVLLSFFSVRYAFDFLQLQMPEAAIRYALVDTVISGMLAGYFLGKSICYAARFYRGYAYDTHF